jgi:hypothetical protein
MNQLTLPPTIRNAKSKRTPGASLENGTNNKRWVPHGPDFLWRLVALIHSMRLSLMKGAHADFSCAAWQEIGSSPVFGLEWDTQHSTTPQSPSCVIRSEGEGPAVLSTSSRPNGAPHPGFPVKFVGVEELHRKSGDVGCHSSPPGHPACQGVPWEQSTCLWQVEKEMTQQNSPRMRGPEGRLAKLQPSPEGLGINPEEDMSAVGAALNPARTCVIPRPQP